MDRLNIYIWNEISYKLWESVSLQLDERIANRHLIPFHILSRRMSGTNLENEIEKLIRINLKLY